MVLPPKVIHPKGDEEISLKKREISALIADTFDGKIHIEWDPQAQVTPLGQLPFFIHFLKAGHLFSITRLKPPASSRLASADKMTHFEECHGLQVWQSYGFSN